MAPLVSLNDVGLRLQLQREMSHTLKEKLVQILRGRDQVDEFWPVKGATFDIARGESVGIIGRNGSGKSSLLKIIAGVYMPTNGSCVVNGRVAPLIELGAGFNGDLTGRENVFLSGAVLGRSREAMMARYDDIVAFAELEAFMDVPVKNYSSGMYARLGFAIATDVDADILIIDEVLAVGDELFQKKCFERLEQHLAAGKTVLFVSHDVGAVKSLCRRAVVMRSGSVIFDGDVDAAIEAYRAHP